LILGAQVSDMFVALSAKDFCESQRQN
jgi:hypothetical protein